MTQVLPIPGLVPVETPSTPEKPQEEAVGNCLTKLINKVINFFKSIFQKIKAFFGMEDKEISAGPKRSEAAKKFSSDVCEKLKDKEGKELFTEFVKVLQADKPEGLLDTEYQNEMSNLVLRMPGYGRILVLLALKPDIGSKDAAAKLLHTNLRDTRIIEVMQVFAS